MYSSEEGLFEYYLSDFFVMVKTKLKTTFYAKFYKKQYLFGTFFLRFNMSQYFLQKN